MKKLAIMFGGMSAEHEVSVRTAQSIYSALTPNKYKVKLIGISPSGAWNNYAPEDLLSIPINSCLPEKNAENPIELLQGIEVVFSVLHGPIGEDGSMQGFLNVLKIPYVGPKVLSSAVCMDKDFMKRILRDAKIAIGDFLVVKKNSSQQISYEQVSKKLGSVVFVKPCNMGSSVGISKVRSEAEYTKALELAFRYDTKVIVEAAVVGREIEIAVLGNSNVECGAIGEVKTKEFYDYESKYVSDSAELIIPAELTTEQIAKVQTTATSAYQALGCEGLARVDLFLLPTGEVLINELNTLPGFTSISMYPKLWEQAGLKYSDLIDKLVNLALE